MRSIFQSWSAAELAEHCGGTLYGDPSAHASSIANDSRRLAKGAMFAALEAERDGHTFIPQARAAGASILLVRRQKRPDAVSGEAVIAVDDTFDALAEIGRAVWRAHGSATPQRVTVGITGSNGKTTTKNLVGSLLREAFGETRVLVTRGNLNSHIGLPIMLAELAADHEYVVLEMGASQPGDIELLANIAPVQRAVVTSIAAAHLEGLGDEAGVEVEKGAIFRGRPAPELAVFPSDRRSLVPADFQGRKVGVGLGTAAAEAEVRDYEGGDAPRFTLILRPPLVEREVCRTISLGLLGRHNAANFASAVASVWDVLPEARRDAIIDRAAESAAGTPGRLVWIDGVEGSRLLDDAYNANPASVRAGLELLADQSGRRWAILGDMLELGDSAETMHREVGAYAAELGCERVWAVGRWADVTVAGARDAGAKDVAAFADATSCAVAARQSVAADDVMLVKGSRGIALDRVVAALATPTSEGAA